MDSKRENCLTNLLVFLDGIRCVDEEGCDFLDLAKLLIKYLTIKG